MKNTILSIAFLFMATGLFAQAQSPAELATASLTALYQLDEKQQGEMLVIQERKYRNLGEIETLKQTDPQKYIQKVKALQQANMGHMRQLLTKEQLTTFRQKQTELRQQKAEVYKEMKGAGKHQSAIEVKMTELDLEALLQS